MSPGNWSPVRLSLPFTDVLSMRAEIIKTTALTFEPDVLLVDHMPHGAMGELVPTLEALDNRPVRTVLGLRDILDAPETVRRRWHLEGAFEVLRRHFDDVFVYGSQDVFDVAEQYAWDQESTSRLSYCGYVCSPPTTQPSEPIRRQYLGDDGESAVVMSLCQVDFRERERRDRWRALPLGRLRLAFAADCSGGTWQVQPVVHDARHEIARHAKPPARAPARLRVGLAEPHDLVAQLHSRHHLGTARSERARSRHELVTRELVELGIGGHRAT